MTAYLYENPDLGADLLKIRQQFEKEKQMNGQPTTQTTFTYAVTLIRTNSQENQELGLSLLLDLHEKDPSSDYMFFITIVLYKLGNYTNAKKFADAFVQANPNNRQGLELKQAVDGKIDEEGKTGLAILGGAAALAALGALVIGAALIKKK